MAVMPARLLGASRTSMTEFSSAAITASSEVATLTSGTRSLPASIAATAGALVVIVALGVYPNFVLKRSEAATVSKLPATQPSNVANK